MPDHNRAYWLASWEAEQSLRDIDQAMRDGNVNIALERAQRLMGEASSMVTILTMLWAEENS